jgi:hypothetical protein
MTCRIGSTARLVNNAGIAQRFDRLFGVRGRTRALDGAEADALYSLTSWPDY